MTDATIYSERNEIRKEEGDVMNMTTAKPSAAKRKKAENLFWKKGNSSDMSNNTDIAVPVMRYSDYLIGGISHDTDYCRPSGRRKN